MIRDTLKIIENFITRTYTRLNREQYSVICLYREGGISNELLNIELRKIYLKMKICKMISDKIVKYRIKAQSFVLGN